MTGRSVAENVGARRSLDEEAPPGPAPSLALAPVPLLTSRRILPQDVIRTAAAPLRARAGFRARVGVEAHSARDRDTSAPPSLGFRVVSGSFVVSALLRRRPLLGPSRSLL